MPALGHTEHRFAITAISTALPCVVTTDENDFSSGDLVRLTDLNGMMPYPRGQDPLNNYKFEIVVIDTENFSLKDPITHKDIDSTNYPPYVEGGSANLVPSVFYYYGEVE